MKKHFVAIGFDGTVLLSGTKEPDGICVNYISPKLSVSEFSSVDDVLMHPNVERIETPKPVNESVSAPVYSVGGIELTRAESVIFDTLKHNRGKFVPQNILSMVLETFGRADKNSLRTLISRLRKKLASTGLTIETGWKKGYKLKL